MRKSIKLKGLANFCGELLKELGPRHLILLEGPLGAGKTAFVGECVKLLGGVESDSPTFSIINEYDCNPKVFHVDLYRLDSEEEIESTGFWDLFDIQEGYIFVEWSEKVRKEDWPKNWPCLKIAIGYTNEPNERLFSINTNV